MTKRQSSKYKIDRRIGDNLWGRPKSPQNKREYGPGQHGQRRKNKISDYGVQLKAKQTLKGYYGNITERQFRKIYAEASRKRGDTGENFIGLLERRLDAVVYRAKFVPTVFASRQFVNHGHISVNGRDAKFVPTVFASRQFVNHGHISVNGRRVNIPSFLVKEGDVVSVGEKGKDMELVAVAVQSPERDVPDYLEVDHSKLTAKFTRTPKLNDVPYPVRMEPNLVVEFYSR